MVFCKTRSRIKQIHRCGFSSDKLSVCFQWPFTHDFFDLIIDRVLPNRNTKMMFRLKAMAVTLLVMTLLVNKHHCHSHLFSKTKRNIPESDSNLGCLFQMVKFP